MKTKEQRYNELYSSGLVDSIKELFANRNDISEDYYVLMADYIDSMNEIKDILYRVEKYGYIMIMNI